MLDNSQAFSLAAKEIRVKRYKWSLWSQACRLAELNDLNREAVYARLRVLQLTRSIDEPADCMVARSDVLASLKLRSEQCLWEGCLLLSGALITLLGSLQL